MPTPPRDSGFRPRVLAGNLGFWIWRFFNCQFQRFWREILNFEFQKRNRRPRVNQGWSWSGARLLVWRRNVSLPLERPGFFLSLLQRRSWVVLGSSRKRSTKLRKGGASPHAAILPMALVCPFPQISTGVRFRFFFYFWGAFWYLGVRLRFFYFWGAFWYPGVRLRCFVF